MIQAGEIAKLLNVEEDDGNLLVAIALTEESRRNFNNAMQIFETSFDHLTGITSRYGCVMGLSRCAAWKGQYDRAIEKAEEALSMMGADLGYYFDRFEDLNDTEKNAVLEYQQFRRDAMLQQAQCHSSRDSANDFKHVIRLVSAAREMQHQPPLGGFVLNRLMDALEHPDNQGSKGAGRVFFSSWTDRDQDAWFKWVFETQNDLGFGKLREAASEDSNKVDKLFKILKRAAKPLRATPEWCWAHFKTAMLHRSLCNDDKKAKQIIGSLLTGKDSRHSQQILFDARLMLSDILYEEFRRIESLGSKSWPELISEMEKIPKLDQTWENSVLKNSLVSVNLARMYRIHGDLARYKAMLEETFQSCVQGLRDNQATNDVANLRLLAKVLSFFEVLKDDAQIAISLQFSYLNSSMGCYTNGMLNCSVRASENSIRRHGSTATVGRLFRTGVKPKLHRYMPALPAPTLISAKNASIFDASRPKAMCFTIGGTTVLKTTSTSKVLSMGGRVFKMARSGSKNGSKG